MDFSSKFKDHVVGKGLIIFGIPVGQTKHLFDRYRNYLGWVQLPIIVYTAILQTIQYFPQYLSGMFVEISLVLFFLFVGFTAFIMYVDLNYIFPNEREFMFNKTPYFERRFNELSQKMDRCVK